MHNDKHADPGKVIALIKKKITELEIFIHPDGNYLPIIIVERLRNGLQNMGILFGVSRFGEESDNFMRDMPDSHRLHEWLEKSNQLEVLREYLIVAELGFYLHLKADEDKNAAHVKVSQAYLQFSMKLIIYELSRSSESDFTPEGMEKLV